jgi:hypothetical protein
LYLSCDQSIETDRYELPPVPPSGTLDARFDTKGSIAIGGKDGHSEYSLLVTGAQFPVEMSWDISSTESEWLLEISSAEGVVREVPLHGKGEIILKENTISHAKIRSKFASPSNVPVEFALQRNYPNPFNPSTEIRYSLASAGNVSLKIYNVLGELVAALVDGVQPASYQSVVWNAATISSGVYFYELRVVDPTSGSLKFRSIQKMVLLK